MVQTKLAGVRLDIIKVAVKSSASAFLLVIAAVCGLSGCGLISSRTVRAAIKPESERKLAPDFTLKDSTGATVKLSDYRGKVVLLNFWATWCGPCKIEIPWFMEFEKAYKDRKFAVLGVSMDEDGWESVRPYIDAQKINYRILVGTEEFSNIYGGVDSLPTTFMLDRDGRIAAMHVGLVSKGIYEQDIRHLLDAAQPANSVGAN